jgi:hypothetical protein
MVAVEQWNQQFTSEPPVRPVDELSTAMTQLRPLLDVHQLCSARVTYERRKYKLQAKKTSHQQPDLLL